MRTWPLLILCLCLLSCQHQNLLPSTPVSWHKARNGTRADCQGSLIVQGRDVWSSTVLRWFTPLADNDSSFRLESTATDSLLTLPDQAPLRLSDSKLKTWDRIYLESLRLYLRLPQELSSAFNVANLGVRNLGADRYSAVFFTLKPGVWNDPSLDQYIAYFTEGGEQLRFVQFTYRDLSRSYVGWMRYGSEKQFAAFAYPGSIEILDQWDDQESVHTITLEAIDCQATSGSSMIKEVVPSRRS